MSDAGFSGEFLKNSWLIVNDKHGDVLLNACVGSDVIRKAVNAAVNAVTVFSDLFSDVPLL